MTGNAGRLIPQTSSLPAELGSLGSRSLDRQWHLYIILAAPSVALILPAAAGLLVQRFVTFCLLLAFEARGELLARLFVPYETRVITGEGKGEQVRRAAEVIRAVPPSARGLPRGRSGPTGAPAAAQGGAGRQLRAPGGQREPRQPSQMEF